MWKVKIDDDRHGKKVARRWQSGICLHDLNRTSRSNQSAINILLRTLHYIDNIMLIYLATEPLSNENVRVRTCMRIASCGDTATAS